MAATLSTLIQPFSSWTLVKHLLNPSKSAIRDGSAGSTDLETFLKPHFERGVFLNGSSSF